MLQQTAAKWQARTAAYARNSFLLAYTTLVDNTLVALLQALRVDDLFKRATPWLEDSLARLTGLVMSSAVVQTASAMHSIRRLKSPSAILDVTLVLKIVFGRNKGCLVFPGCRI